jgi:hypothetical protein
MNPPGGPKDDVMVVPFDTTFSDYYLSDRVLATADAANPCDPR